MFRSGLVICLVLVATTSSSGFAAVSSAPSSIKSVPIAETTNNKKTNIINKIMADSGMDALVYQLPAVVAMEFDRQPPPPVNRERFDKFRENVLQAYAPDKVRQAFVNYLSDHYDPDHFSKLVELLESPLAKKMTALEVEAQTAEGQQAMMQMANIIMGQVSPQRMAMVQRLDEVQQATEMLVDIQVMTAKAMMNSMNEIVPQDQRMSEKELSQRLEQLRAQAVFPARQYMHLNMVYAYRSASDDELSQYVQLHESEIGRWSAELLRNASMSVYENISAELAETMK